MIESAIGGVLFIDEAYQLAAGGHNDFGAEAITTLLTEMDNRRHELVVIMAGYPDSMEGLLDSNPGLRGRFTREIEFKDYSTDQLAQIIEGWRRGEQYQFADGVTRTIKRRLDDIKLFRQRQPNQVFANAREARNLWDAIRLTQSVRLYREYENRGVPRDCLMRIVGDDILNAPYPR